MGEICIFELPPWRTILPFSQNFGLQVRLTFRSRAAVGRRAFFSACLDSLVEKRSSYKARTSRGGSLSACARGL